MLLIALAAAVSGLAAASGGTAKAVDSFIAALPKPGIGAVAGLEGALWNVGAYAGLNQLPPGSIVNGDSTPDWKALYGLGLGRAPDRAAVAPLALRVGDELKGRMERLHALPEIERDWTLHELDYLRNGAARDAWVAADAMMDAELRSLDPQGATDPALLSEQIERLEELRPFLETLQLYGGGFQTLLWEFDVKATEMRRRRLELQALAAAARIGRSLDDLVPSRAPAPPRATDFAHFVPHGHAFDPATGLTVVTGRIGRTDARLRIIDGVRGADLGPWSGALHEADLKALWTAALREFRRDPHGHVGWSMLIGVVRALDLKGDIDQLVDAVLLRRERQK